MAVLNSVGAKVTITSTFPLAGTTPTMYIHVQYQAVTIAFVTQLMNEANHYNVYVPLIGVTMKAGWCCTAAS